MVDPLSREEAVDALHDFYTRGRLRILTGAGTSIPSGLPNWDSLNLGLLQALIHSDASDKNLWAALIEPELPKLTRSLYDILGRNGAADFVRMARSKQFERIIAKVLYQEVSLDTRALTDVQYQLGTMAVHAPLLTTNFDPLIEVAMAALHGSAEWKQYRATTPRRSARFRTSLVEHIHGWIDPGGPSSGTLVLTESDYFRLAAGDNEPANRRLKQLFAEPGAVLIIGMSMEDTNIRRLLYVLRSGDGAALPPVFLVTKTTDPIVDSYASEYWRKRALRLIFISKYEELAGILRDVAWGRPRHGNPPNWLKASLDWIDSTLGTELLLDGDWQILARDLLRTLRSRVRQLFAIRFEERCHFGLFVPMRQNGTVRLALAATSRGLPGDLSPGGGMRSLSIARGQEQGSGGISFSTGIIKETLFGDSDPDFNFTPGMKSQWVNELGFRDWRSVLSVPVLAGRDWTPVAVITVTSNLSKPFWSTFGSDEQIFRAELVNWMRETAMLALGGFKRWYPKSGR
jgi:hypothetical protein